MRISDWSSDVCSSDLTGSVYGIEELALSFAVWFYFIGAARGAYTRSHISASLIDLLIQKGRAKNLVVLATATLTAALSIWVTVWAVQYVLWVHERDMISLDLRFQMIYVHARSDEHTYELQSLMPI